MSQLSLRRGVFSVSLLTFLSRLLGLLRDIIIATSLGAGWASDALFVALRLPNMFRAFSAEGAFSMAFIPVYTSLPPLAAQRFAMMILTALLPILLLFLLVTELLMTPLITHLIAPGFQGETLNLAIHLSRITMPYLVFITLCTFWITLLNAHTHFATSTIPQPLYNAAILLFFFVSSSFFVSPAVTIAYAVFFAGSIQLLFILWAARKHGLNIPSLKTPSLTPPMRRFLRFFRRSLIASGIFQFYLLVDMIFASFMAAGSLSYLFYAERLSQLPIGLIGAALSVVSLPLLSKTFAQSQHKGFALFNKALHLALFLSLPAALGLGLTAEMIIRSLFAYKAFTLQATTQVTLILQLYCLGVPGIILYRLLGATFSARRSFRKPILAVALGTLAKILLSLLWYPYAHLGLATATSVSMWIMAIVLMGLLWREGWRPETGALLKAVKFLSALVSVALIAWGGNLWGQTIQSSVFLFLLMIGVILLSIFLFFLLCFRTQLLKKQDLQELFLPPSASQ